jgi:hypothetical protein
VSDPAKYFGWVYKLNQVIKKAKYIAVRPSQIFWLSLYTKSSYNKKLNI